MCLNLLRSRRTRREDELDESLHADAPAAAEDPEGLTVMADEVGLALQHADARAAEDPESLTVMADEVGLALQVVPDSLNPAERVAFVLLDPLND